MGFMTKPNRLGPIEAAEFVELDCGCWGAALKPTFVVHIQCSTAKNILQSMHDKSKSADHYDAQRVRMHRHYTDNGLFRQSK